MENTPKEKNQSRKGETLDPFAEPRTIPGQWDVTAFESMVQPSNNGSLQSEPHREQNPKPTGRDEVDQKPASFTTRYLDPDFDQGGSPPNSSWSAY